MSEPLLDDRQVDGIGRDRVGVFQRAREAQRLAIGAGGAGVVAGSRVRRGARLGFAQARLRWRAALGWRRRAGAHQRKQARGVAAVQRPRPLPCASKLSIGSMPSELSLNVSLSGQTRFAAVITSPASRAAVSLRSRSGRASRSVAWA